MKFKTLIRKIRILKFPLIKKHIKFVIKIYVKSRKPGILNSLTSSILRSVFRFKIMVHLLYYLRKNTRLKDVNEFWIIHIGFIRKKNYFPFINLDSYISNNPFNL